ncbi:MAG: hypothetical protein ACKPKO_62175, partial [Candidatus Fonsibacter sp.]
QGIYLGQASTASSGIEMVASSETTIDFSTPGINYKGRIQYNITTNAVSFFHQLFCYNIIGSNRLDDG